MAQLHHLAIVLFQPTTVFFYPCQMNVTVLMTTHTCKRVHGDSFLGYRQEDGEGGEEEAHIETMYSYLTHCLRLLLGIQQFLHVV